MGERQFSPKDARDANYQRRRKRKKCWPKSSRRTHNARSPTGLGCQNQNEQQHIGKPTGEVTPRLELILPSGQLVSIKRQAVNVTNAATFMPASWYYPALEQQLSEEEHSGNEQSLSDSFDDTPTDSAFDMTVGGVTRNEAHDFFDFTVGGMPLEKEQSGVSCCTHSINDTESCCSCSSRERTVSPESQSHSTTSILSMSTSDDGSSTNHVEDRGLRQHERRSWSEWGSAVDPLSLHHPQNCILDRTAKQFPCFYDDWCFVSSERSAEKEPQELTWSYKLSPPLNYCTTLTDRTEAEMNSLFEFDFLPDQLNAEVAAQQALQEWFGPFIDGLMRMQRVPSKEEHRVTAEKLGGSVRIDPEILQEAQASLQKIAYFYSSQS